MNTDSDSSVDFNNLKMIKKKKKEGKKWFPAQGFAKILCGAESDSEHY